MAVESKLCIPRALPVELLQKILLEIDAKSFNTLKNASNSWRAASMNKYLLDTRLSVINCANIEQMVTSTNLNLLSKRLSREIELGGAQDGTCGLIHTLTWDLGPYSSHPAKKLHITTSICGKFFMMCENKSVVIFKLVPEEKDPENRLQYYSHVVCPHRVLAVAMDSSANAHELAILMENRYGALVPLQCNPAQPLTPTEDQLFEHLRSADDPPRSVATHPSQKITMFGNHAGVEVIWRCKSTKVQRFMCYPMTTPSDFVMFNPPKRGIESASVVRVMSSSVLGEDAPPIARRFGQTRADIDYWDENSAPIFTHVPLPTQMTTDAHMVTSLGDGLYFIFTDPSDNTVYVGTESPAHTTSKYVRSFKLIPPTEYILKTGSKEELSLFEFDPVKVRPTFYSGGYDHSQGLRIVVAYGNWLVFYTVPSGIFMKDKCAAARRLVHEGQNGETVEIPPLQEINGCHLSFVRGLVDVAVDSKPQNMCVWAFTRNGCVLLFQLKGTFKHKDKDKMFMPQEADRFKKWAGEMDGMWPKLPGEKRNNRDWYDFPDDGECDNGVYGQAVIEEELYE